MQAFHKGPPVQCVTRVTPCCYELLAPLCWLEVTRCADGAQRDDLFTCGWTSGLFQGWGVHNGAARNTHVLPLLRTGFPPSGQ